MGRYRVHFRCSSFALVFAGKFDGHRFERRNDYLSFYRELKPISESFEPEAMRVNGLDRSRLITCGEEPEHGHDGSEPLGKTGRTVGSTGLGCIPTLFRLELALLVFYPILH